MGRTESSQTRFKPNSGGPSLPSPPSLPNPGWANFFLAGSLLPRYGPCRQKATPASPLPDWAEIPRPGWAESLLTRLGQPSVTWLGRVAAYPAGQHLQAERSLPGSFDRVTPRPNPSDREPAPSTRPEQVHRWEDCWCVRPSRCPRLLRASSIDMYEYLLSATRG